MSTPEPQLKTTPASAPATGSAVKCKVWTSFWDGTTWRHSETCHWMSEEDALAFAAGVWNNREGKEYKLSISYRRKFNGRWCGAGSKPYPPNDPK